MSLIQTILLGAIAGFTIYLGLPIGRIKGLSDKFRSFLSMLSTGIRSEERRVGKECRL